MNSDNESELERALAELPPAERNRLLGIDFDLQRELSKKNAYRQMLKDLAPAKKLKLLEELRERAQLQKGTRRSEELRISSQTRRNTPAHRFGGRATAGGVNYEVRVASYIAVKMLAGNRCAVWEGISGDQVTAITLQAPEPVDDIRVNLVGDSEACVFIAAKQRSGTIALTEKNAAFTETVSAFVCQYLKLTLTARAVSRLVWAVPSSVGRATTHALIDALKAHRLEADDSSLSSFMHGRGTTERKALEALLRVANAAWKRFSGTPATDGELQRFLRMIYVEVYDFGSGQQLERQAENDLRSHILMDAAQAANAWQKLERFFTSVDQHGVRVTASSLRRVLTAGDLTLKAPPDFTDDIARLRELTRSNIARLAEYTTLRFGRKPDEIIHVPRTAELSTLLAAAKSGNLLITGEPGCGKSGLIHSLVMALEQENCPVVLLLAEDVFTRDWKGAANLPGFTHTLDEILANWPNGAHGIFITDALDAVRDLGLQKMLRYLLSNVRDGGSGWTVIASVREFDLKYGRELREMFPGTGVASFESNDFAGVAHFYLTRFTSAELDAVTAKCAALAPFITSAHKDFRSGGVQRSPFYLRLAAELLRDGVPPSRLADWNSPAVLLRKFWEIRIKGDEGANDREVTLRAICRQMMSRYSMIISLKDLSLSAEGIASVLELRSRGILQSPMLRNGMNVGEDEIRFTHHLLHDYVIARALIPETPTLFCDFAIREPLLPVFYRQSFIFALEELWDAPDGRDGFWSTALKLETVPTLHSVARILAPLLASHRVEVLADLQPLLTAVGVASDASSAGAKALQHLASGFQDASKDAISAGAVGWCSFTEQLARLLPTKVFLEGPLTIILDHLRKNGFANDPALCLPLNCAARGLLSHHVAKEVNKGWRYSAYVATDLLCRTFSATPTETEQVLLRLLTPTRVAHFPHDDLFDLAQSIQYLGDQGNTVVLRLFEAAFGVEPEKGQWENNGSAILSLRMQTSDRWNSIHYTLAQYYETQTGSNARLMTEAVCIAWNAVVRRRRSQDVETIATIQFRGVPCRLIEDYSHIWGREFEHEENQILTHFERVLREWAKAGDTIRLSAALDGFAARNHTSLMWSVFMEAGAEYPLTLGVLLETVLREPVFLTHSDYAYGAAALLGALHRVGDVPRRERLELLILDLPKQYEMLSDETSEQASKKLAYTQGRLLGVLDESNIVLDAIRDLRREHQEASDLPENRKTPSPRFTSHTLSDEEIAGRRGIDLSDPANEQLFRLREALKPFLGTDSNKYDAEGIEAHWSLIQQCESALTQHSKKRSQMATDLWGHLVAACERIVRIASWAKTSERWNTLRAILLKAAEDPVPRSDDDDDKEDRWPSWGWPSPRISAAQGLPFLVSRVGKADDATAAALRRLSRDKSHPLRFNLADRLALLETPAPDLMWELIDMFIEKEKKFSVLEMVVTAVDSLWTKWPEHVNPRLRQIADRARQAASVDHQIHESLTHVYLLHFLRTGDVEGATFVDTLISECSSNRASHALGPQVHHCRDVLTADDNAFRMRAWQFLSKVLVAAQKKLQEHREELRQLYANAQPSPATAKPTAESLDRALQLVDDIAMQLYFASGAYSVKSATDKEGLSSHQIQRFWQESAPLFQALANEPCPHTTYHIVQTLQHLLPCSPREIFLLAARSILSGAKANFQHESLAVGEVVKLIQRALADHREIFRSDSECLAALLQVIDLFVDAGWSEARQLTHRLEEIYR